MRTGTSRDGAHIDGHDDIRRAILERVIDDALDDEGRTYTADEVRARLAERLANRSEPARWESIEGFGD